MIKDVKCKVCNNIVKVDTEKDRVCCTKCGSIIYKSAEVRKQEVAHLIQEDEIIEPPKSEIERYNSYNNVGRLISGIILTFIIVKFPELTEDHHLLLNIIITLFYITFVIKTAMGMLTIIYYLLGEKEYKKAIQTKEENLDKAKDNYQKAIKYNNFGWFICIVALILYLSYISVGTFLVVKGDAETLHNAEINRIEEIDEIENNIQPQD